AVTNDGRPFLFQSSFLVIASKAKQSKPRRGARWIASPRSQCRRSIQKALRIDVDLQLEIALGLWTGGEPFAQVFRQIDIAQRLHQQAKPVAALDDGKRRFGRPEHLDALVDRGYRSQPARKPFGGRG